MERSRKLKVWEAWAISLGLMAPTLAMAGNGQGLIASVGKAIPLVFVCGLVAVALVAFGFLRLVRIYHHAGSAYAFVGATLGPRSGLLAGFALLGTYLFFSIATLAALGAFTNALLAELQPGVDKPFGLPWIVSALIGAALSAYLNNRDCGMLTKVLMIIEGIGILFMAILVAVIFDHGGAETTHVDFSSFSLDGVGLSAVAAAVVAAFLSWAGFEACATLGEETDDPRRNIPYALVGSVALTGVLFIVVMFAQTIGFGTDAAGLAAFQHSANTLGSLAKQYVGPTFAAMVIVTGVVSALASHLSSVAAASRLVFALARDELGPAPLAWINPHSGQPRNAAWLIVAISALVDGIAYCTGHPKIATSDAAIGVFFYFGIVGTVCLMIVYLMLELATIRLIASGRLRIGKWEIMVPALAAAVLILALYFSLADEWHPLAAAAVALAWCALGSATIALAPDRMRSIGEKLADDLHLSNQT
jgi:amino acid transporter